MCACPCVGVSAKDRGGNSDMYVQLVKSRPSY